MVLTSDLIHGHLHSHAFVHCEINSYKSFYVPAAAQQLVFPEVLWLCSKPAAVQFARTVVLAAFAACMSEEQT